MTPEIFAKIYPKADDDGAKPGPFRPARVIADIRRALAEHDIRFDGEELTIRAGAVLSEYVQGGVVPPVSFSVCRVECRSKHWNGQTNSQTLSMTCLRVGDALFQPQETTQQEVEQLLVKLALNSRRSRDIGEVSWEHGKDPSRVNLSVATRMTERNIMVQVIHEHVAQAQAFALAQASPGGFAQARGVRL